MSGPLEKIESVPWSKLQHAYGPATDVPRLLNALLSKRESDRKQAWRELYGNIWHQSTVYEATPQVVPFLIRLLQYPGTRDKHEILLFLACLYFGHSGQEASFANETVRAVEQGAATYLAALHDPESPVRLAAAYVLGLLRVENVGDEVVVEQVAQSATDRGERSIG